MVPQLIKNQTNLYDTDYNLWILDTVELLKTKNWENLDLVNLIEELENLGKNDFNKVRSLCKTNYYSYVSIGILGSRR